MNIVKTNTLSQEDKHAFFHCYCGGSRMVVSSGDYDLNILPGLAAIEGDEIIGILTFLVFEAHVEIISLHCSEQNKGVGTRLINMLDDVVKQHQKHKLKVITTNDNLDALRFYQKRGFRIVNVLPNAVETARAKKPDIPKLSESGIPIKDELVLLKSYT